MKRVAACGAVIRDGSGRILLVLRGRPPAAGRWSIPGGRAEPGETLPAALTRGVREETGLDIAVGPLLGDVVLPGAGADTVYDVSDYAATVTGGTLRAGDDAAGVRWCSRAELEALPLTAGLLDHLERWRVF